MACLLSTGLAVQAESKQTVTVGGRTLEQNVASITFDGDNVVLTMADGIPVTADMGEVTMAFEWNTSTAIGHVDEQPVVADGSGYDLQGRMLRNAQPDAQFSTLNSQFKKGIYLVRQNGKTIKVFKK